MGTQGFRIAITAFCRPLAGNWIGSGAGGSQIGTLKACQCNRRQVYPYAISAPPNKFLILFFHELVKIPGISWSFSVLSKKIDFGPCLTTFKKVIQTWLKDMSFTRWLIFNLFSIMIMHSKCKNWSVTLKSIRCCSEHLWLFCNQSYGIYELWPPHPTPFEGEELMSEFVPMTEQSL